MYGAFDKAVEVGEIRDQPGSAIRFSDEEAWAAPVRCIRYLLDYTFIYEILNCCSRWFQGVPDAIKSDGENTIRGFVHCGAFTVTVNAFSASVFLLYASPIFMTSWSFGLPVFGDCPAVILLDILQCP